MTNQLVLVVVGAAALYKWSRQSRNDGGPSETIIPPEGLPELPDDDDELEDDGPGAAVPDFDVQIPRFIWDGRRCFDGVLGDFVEASKCTGLDADVDSLDVGGFSWDEE